MLHSTTVVHPGYRRIDILEMAVSPSEPAVTSGPINNRIDETGVVMRWLLSVLVVVGLAGALPLSTSAPAHACSCVYEADGPQIAEQISYAASAFTGTVTTKRIEDQVGFYEFDVREVFEGNVGAKTVVSAYVESASCGRSFEIGTEYIVFTSTSKTHGAP
ncbi:hypothetical protein B2J88_44435, partial [Rhodococcus sp. SRB_17]|nr:hypothetical protein [Rhodococcus sp. SRB_17]